MNHASTHSHVSEALPESSFFSYAVGFVFSILLTLGSFEVAPLLGTFAPFAIVVGALLQLFVQLVFFLHLGRERGPKWNLGIFMFTLVIIGILIGGTLWIMSNLAHLHMHSPTTDDLYRNGIVAPANELK
ncbi:MAG: cytochrome o ubiquinol oxidase subunit [Parcubacteria group bacterium]|nr:cytochrome o ubiquinol oxidase subunit [Parcubacteria group bacterium]